MRKQLLLKFNFLKDRDKLIISLFNHGLRGRQIASRVGCSYSALRSRLSVLGLRYTQVNTHPYGYTKASNGYWKLTTPIGSEYHKYSNSVGWQYIHRIAGCLYAGRVLASYEQVHHLVPYDTDGDYSILELVEMFDDRYEILMNTQHSMYHSKGKDRDKAGRYRSVEEAAREYPLDWDVI